MDVEVEDVMDYIRSRDHLTTEVDGMDSLTFLHQIIERCAVLSGEIAHELVKEMRDARCQRQ